MGRAVKSLLAFVLLSASASSLAGPRQGTLVLGGCFWRCPEYAVTVHEDGRVAYLGVAHVDIEGPRSWRLAPTQVAPIFELAGDTGLWTAEPRYFRRIHDAEIRMLRLRDGDRNTQVVAYPADHSALPAAFGEIADRIIRHSGARDWARISESTVLVLEQEGFDFSSRESGLVFQRAVAQDGWVGRGDISEAGLLAWLRRGPPLDVAANASGRTALSPALEKRLETLVEPLIARGVLHTGGEPDQAKLDAAFQSAIRSGRLAWAQRIWDAEGPRMRPGLEYTPRDGNLALSRTPRSVVLLLEPDWYPEDWEGLAILEWLVEKGARLDDRGSNGRTLFDVATRAQDPAFMRYLLERGLDPAAMSPREMMDFGVKHGEDIALALRDAHLRHDPDWRVPRGYRAAAELQGWTRVLAWLDQTPRHAEADDQATCEDAPD